MSKKKEEIEEKPKVHKDLDGFDIKINTFGEIQMSYDIEKINQFLNKNVDDKKLRDIDLEKQMAKPKKKK
ncbi:hypothetical protein [Jiulongibacter sp. NS-SX5]|uniref:hypothetical protein n=1 Tax=Jiulongibacter sp. NS-SX5 TaxID=3463854 RepID=UPI0040593409